MSDFTLTILHSNDTHSYLDDFAKRAHIINTIRTQNQDDKHKETLLIDAGDVLSGSIYFNMYKREKEAELLNLLQYDMMALGNHEFDCGSTFLSQFINQLNFPVINSNIDFSNDIDLSPLQNNYKICPYIIKEYSQNVKIGIFALLTESTVESATPSKETRFIDPLKKASEMIQFFKHNGVENIILISHLGIDDDIQLAKQYEGINLIIGAHSHTVLETPLFITTENHTTAIVQTGNYGQFLGDVSITFNKGKISAIHGMLHDIKHHQYEDFSIKSIINQMRLERQRLSETPLCSTQILLNGERSDSKFHETNLGHLVADAYYHAAYKQNFRPDLAIINGGGIRTSLYPGYITYADIINVLPFSKSLMILEVTGKQLKEALQNGLSPQVSHLRVFYDETQIIREMQCLKMDNSIEIIQNDKIYRIATNSFVGHGKDNYKAFSGTHFRIENIELDVVLFQNFLTSLPQPIYSPFIPRFRKK